MKATQLPPRSFHSARESRGERESPPVWGRMKSWSNYTSTTSRLDSTSQREESYLSADRSAGQGKNFESLQRVFTYSTSLRLQCVRRSASIFFLPWPLRSRC